MPPSTTSGLAMMLPSAPSSSIVPSDGLVVTPVTKLPTSGMAFWIVCLMPSVVQVMSCRPSTRWCLRSCAVFASRTSSMSMLSLHALGVADLVARGRDARCWCSARSRAASRNGGSRRTTRWRRPARRTPRCRRRPCRRGGGRRARRRAAPATTSASTMTTTSTIDSGSRKETSSSFAGNEEPSWADWGSRPWCLAGGLVLRKRWPAAGRAAAADGPRDQSPQRLCPTAMSEL